MRLSDVFYLNLFAIGYRLAVLSMLILKHMTQIGGLI
jgi:hypothetical protein